MENFNEEIWKPVMGYEGYYECSNLGRVRSVDRYVNNRHKNGLQFKRGQILKTASQRGYRILILSKEGKQVCKKVHRLVAESFIPNPDNLPFVNHKDENKTNNCVDNLEWCTVKYNSNYGTATEKRLNNAKKHSKPVLQFDLNGNFIKEWSSINLIEKELGYFSALIIGCCKQKYKQGYGYIWRYK